MGEPCALEESLEVMQDQLLPRNMASSHSAPYLPPQMAELERDVGPEQDSDLPKNIQPVRGRTVLCPPLCCWPFKPSGGCLAV